MAKGTLVMTANKPGNMSQPEHQTIDKKDLEIHTALFPMMVLHVKQRGRGEEKNQNDEKSEADQPLPLWKRVRMEGEAGQLRHSKDTVGTEKTICKDNRYKMNDR